MMTSFAPQKATQQQTKTHNSQLVLSTIYERGPVSRAELARLTNLTRTTVSELVGELQERGLIEEVGMGLSGGGRVPILLNLVPDGRYGISLDLANDEFRGAVVNLRNEIVQTVSLPLPGRGGVAALELVYDLIDSLIARTDKPLLGIGIGTPGLVDTSQGVVIRAVNLAWQDLPLGSLLRERYNLPVYIANDSQLTALGQYMADETGRGANLVVIKVGQGLGAGIILNGQLFQGDGYGAGEIGHVVVVENGQPCRCGNFGCLETVVSNRAIAHRAQILARTTRSTLLHQRTADPNAISIAAIGRAAAAGDELAQRLMHETGRYLGMAAAALVGALNVRRILVMGQIACWGLPLRDTIRQEMFRRALPALSQDTVVELLDVPDDTVLKGAAALLLTNELGLTLAQ